MKEWYKTIMGNCFILFCVSVNPLVLYGKEEKMFELANCSEWGGILVEFSKGEDSQSITVSKDSKVIKISAPNKKGRFEWKDIRSFNYKKTEIEKGIFTVYFIDKIPGAESGSMIFGVITRECWKRIEAHVMGEIKIIEE